ncbi:putative capping protein alpha-like subunit [Neospora caninum Liverpool]|uniref:Capping protein alpha-like subunit, putative n=1 Tax=Neospora caninum (strain Liverpool) TaxID=572307 RepID=F0V7X8_NEOCL|nr:putative capping protein alpha-like subunit [Neospora caninum Liverpool]CBZ49819.1 putative capping protein alpha-like subunit [Neospora caninum Liverpool]CEL64409.1 TPA: capping protein alpha-like subunit, putative [Neospora caninum Liverpool]|eukprot:XP_003879854.1 putative capping protein alpha-like subunit [Neospora caninum Liverpool]
MEEAANGLSRLSSGVGVPRSATEDDSGDAATLARNRCIVRFFANNSPPDQLRSVVEDCELLADDETLMGYDFVEEVCEAAHDDSLALFAFVPDDDQPFLQGIMCREGKLSENVYLYPPAKLAVTLSHSTCSLILPPRPAPSTCFPEEVEPYRKALEDAFSRYVELRYSDDAVEPRRSAVRTRHATAVYARILPETEKNASEETAEPSDGPALPSETDAYAPPQSAAAVAYVQQGGGKIYKLTAAMSLRHSNAESCWAAARTSYWEVYFSTANQRLAIEGKVRLRSHTCEDWNAQVDYQRIFVSPTEASRGKPREMPQAPEEDSNGARETPEQLSDASREKAHASAQEGSRPAERREGLYVEKCVEVNDPSALVRRVLEFIKDKEADVLGDERHCFQAYVPATLRALRRVLSLTGRTFDWQQQSLQL